ncbi:terpene synthase family protein [Nonomuraea turcica]|uniref:terpene synthase family protein n=1 Tax=Nonomuraea sp. G32 TaxID=3067274 RepID=UPI00273C383D|nr:terpene synthase family protein [Nonomuraea sp. G32]MDP4508309.1 terpene synthase family protein [Nonomuraea sp. G32]
MSDYFETGRTCALAVASGRELARFATRYDGLFPEKSFDAGLYGALAMAGAFCAPWATVEGLRAVNRASLLVFALDRLIDEEASSREQVGALVGECLAAAGGAAPESQAAAFVADLRSDLAAPPELDRAWRDQLERMLRAMAREWDWSGSERPPTRQEYLANADSCGALFIGLSHWIHTGLVEALGDLDRLRPAADAVQRCLRLLNDLATRRRESGSGDVNAFTLGMELDEVIERLSELTEDATELIEPLRNAYPRAAEYLAWQIHYSAGFYGLSDFWAES